MNREKARKGKATHTNGPLTEHGKTDTIGHQVVEASGRFRERSRARGGRCFLADSEWLLLVERLSGLDPQDFEAIVAAVRLTRLLQEPR
jgi:hypothetical protein